jgi:hypothetical protein
MAYVMEYVDVTLRQGGMGSLLIKNHLYLHLHDYMLKWGPLRQMNSGPNESHHKTEVKAPSKNTQRRVDSFIKQTAKRYTEMRLVRKACRHFGISEAQILSGQIPPNCKNLSISGAYYSVGLSEHNVPTMQWESRTHRH